MKHRCQDAIMCCVPENRTVHVRKSLFILHCFCFPLAPAHAASTASDDSLYSSLPLKTPAVLSVAVSPPSTDSTASVISACTARSVISAASATLSQSGFPAHVTHTTDVRYSRSADVSTTAANSTASAAFVIFLYDTDHPSSRVSPFFDFFADRLSKTRIFRCFFGKFGV